MRPSFYNSACIMVITYRVRVTATTFSTINIGGGQVTYSTNAAAGIVTSVNLPNRLVAVYPNYGFCSNATGVNTIGTESNGTFGSGNLKNRIASTNVPAGYTYQRFAANAPQDYNYGISNNTSGVYSTNNNLPKPNANRVFTVWDIIGDHTGAANSLLGNPATDTTGGNTGGYMLVVNAAYRIDSSFDQTSGGLCPNTYYEISAWFRNICSRCGCDSTGRGASSAGYIPTAAGDSSGVYPNISIGVDGVTYYTSGDVRYTGQWVKKGFIFVTGPTQTSFTMRVYNNAPGGGGNDWALDDISVSTCLPELQFYPTVANSYCQNSVVSVSSTVSTFFDNYKYYQWERSTDNGTSWHAAPLKPGVDSFSFHYNGVAFHDTVFYPQFMANLMNNGHLFRLRIATTIDNLSNNNCNTYNSSDIVTLVVSGCNILPAELNNFSGVVVNNLSLLKWETLSERNNAWFEIERSADGINFSFVGKVMSKQFNSSASLFYEFNDPNILTSRTYYRLKIVGTDGTSGYSKVILLNHQSGNFEIKALVNPVQSQLQFDLVAPRTEMVTIQLLDTYGRKLKERIQKVEAGINAIRIPAAAAMQRGNYILLIRTSTGSIQKVVQLL
jgi:hypothetical protein